jgi:hypothetical protein
VVPAPPPQYPFGPWLTQADAGADREAEAYKAVRAHELTLNEAKAALERAVLAPLIALNGGAIVAFLTLLGALSGKNSTLNVNTTLAAVAIAAAILVWASGLIFAALAVVWASREQGQINKGYRLMRELVEAKIVAPDVAQIIVPPAPDSEQTDEEGWQKRASDKRARKLARQEVRKGTPWRERRGFAKEILDKEKSVDADDQQRHNRELAQRYASVAGKKRQRRWQSSAGAFLVGALLALVAIGFSDRDNTKTSTTTITTTGPGEPAPTTTTSTTTRTTTTTSP